MAQTIDLETATLANENYRCVVYTDPNVQIVLMCLKSGEDIPSEMHRDNSQFFRVEAGHIRLHLRSPVPRRITIGPGGAVLVPAGTRHRVEQIGAEDAKLYTIYAPPVHEASTVDRRQPLHVT
jgi:mannose-6-phosphate isomerase-like protein (cupin superfamily)